MLRLTQSPGTANVKVNEDEWQGEIMKNDGHQNVLQKKINQTKIYPFFSTVHKKVKGKRLGVAGHENRERE
jgi:hypothetical protein